MQCQPSSSVQHNHPLMDDDDDDDEIWYQSRIGICFKFFFGKKNSSDSDIAN